MILSLLLQIEEIPAVKNTFLDTGIAGACALIFLALYLSERVSREKRDKFIRENGLKMSDSLAHFGSVVKSIQEDTKDIPEHVHQKVDPKLSAIINNTNEIRGDLKMMMSK